MQTARFCADIGSNHNGSLRRAVALIDAAAKAGCWGVKFQDFTAETIFSKEALDARPILRERNRFAIPANWWLDLYARTRAFGLKLGVTPFRRAVEPRLVDFWKVSSYQILEHGLLSGLSAMEKPMVISTGAATMQECIDARICVNPGNVTFLHCVSAYPCPPGLANLGAIDIMQKVLCTPVGWSDHTMDPEVLERAVWRWRASMIEFHLDLDDCEGSETEHSWSPQAIKAVIDRIRDNPLPETLERERPCDGDGKKVPQHCEENERVWRGDPKDGLRPLRQTRTIISRS